MSQYVELRAIGGEKPDDWNWNERAHGRSGP